MYTLIIGALAIVGVLIVSGLIYKRNGNVLARLTVSVFIIVAFLYFLAFFYVIDYHFYHGSKIKEEYDALQYRISTCTLDQEDLDNIKIINNSIQESRDYIDDSWLGIFCIKGIEDYELLDYPKALKIYAENLLKEAE